MVDALYLPLPLHRKQCKFKTLGDIDREAASFYVFRTAYFFSMFMFRMVLKGLLHKAWGSQLIRRIEAIKQKQSVMEITASNSPQPHPTTTAPPIFLLFKHNDSD